MASIVFQSGSLSPKKVERTINYEDCDDLEQGLNPGPVAVVPMCATMQLEMKRMAKIDPAKRGDDVGNRKIVLIPGAPRVLTDEN